MKYSSLQELFSNRKRWTQFANARNKYGLHVMPRSRSAVCWCVSGGVEKVYPRCQRERVFAILGHHHNSLFGSISSWNDRSHRTIDDVRKLVKEAGV